MWYASGVAPRCVEGRALAIVGCSVSEKRVEEISSMDRWWQQRGVQTSVPATSKVWCSLVAATCHANATCVWPFARGCLRSCAPDPWHLARHAAAFLAAFNTNLSKYGQYRGGPGIVTGIGRGRSTRDVHTDSRVLHVYSCVACVSSGLFGLCVWQAVSLGWEASWVRTTRSPTRCSLQVQCPRARHVRAPRAQAARLCAQAAPAAGKSLVSTYTVVEV